MELKPVEYIKSVANRIVFTETITADSVASIGFTCLNIADLELYQNCELEIIVGASMLSGKYRKSIDGTHIFYQVSTNIPIELSPATEAYTYSTFKATKDNQTLTKKDILRELVAKPEVYSPVGDVTEYGVGGIVTSEEKFKVEAVKSWYNQAPKSLTTNFLELFKSRDSEFIVDFGIGMFMFDDECNVVSSQLANTSNKFIFKVTKVVGDLFTYFIVEARVSADAMVNLSVKASSKANIFTELPGNYVESTRQTIVYKDVFGGDITEIEFFPGIIQYNQTQAITSNEYPGFNIKNPIFLAVDADLDSIILPGYYAGDSNQSIGVPNYCPFNLEVKKNSAGIIQTWHSHNVEAAVLYRTKILDTWNPWVAQNNHGHAATDIVEDDEHQFVTIAEKNAIGQTSASPWKPAVTMFADLSTEYPDAEAGWMATVLETNINYGFDGADWLPKSINALVPATSEANGLLSKELFADISRSSFSRVVPNKGVVLRSNTDAMYGNNFEFLGLNAIDLVSRTIALTEKIGDGALMIGENLFSSGANSINIGKNNSSSGVNALLLGQYLNSTVDNQTIFGKYNKSFSGVFAIGFGDEITPKNLLELSSGGILTTAGFAVTGKDATDILLGDGSTRKTSDFLTTNDFKSQTISFTFIDTDDVATEIKVVHIPIVKYAVTITQPANGVINVTLNGVTVNSGDLITEGSNLVVTNTPSEGFELSNYLVNGVAAGSPVTVNAEIVISAEFVAIPNLLYNWSTVETTKLAPTGWHVPTDAEILTLVTTLGGSAVAGGKLKTTGFTDWNTPNTGATNEVGFNAKATGFLFTYGFDGLKTQKWFWTADAANATDAKSFSITNDSAALNQGSSSSKICGFNVRCVKNDDVWTLGDTVTDIDNNVYPTIKIGNQVFMAQDLRVTKLNDGTVIPNVLAANWNATATPARCTYNNL